MGRWDCYNIGNTLYTWEIKSRFLWCVESCLWWGGSEETSYGLPHATDTATTVPQWMLWHSIHCHRLVDQVFVLAAWGSPAVLTVGVEGGCE